MVAPDDGENVAPVKVLAVPFGLSISSNSSLDHVPSVGSTNPSNVKVIVSEAPCIVVPTIPVSGSVGATVSDV